MKRIAAIAVPGGPETMMTLPTVREVTVPVTTLQFEDIYLQYRERIHRRLSRFVGRDAAEDLVQDVFLRVYQALPRLSGEICLEPWLYRIAINIAYDTLRHKRLVNWVALDDLGERPDHDVQADPQVTYSGSSEVIAQTLAQMTPIFRQALLLRLQGYSCAEIGEAISLSPGAVKMRLFRARQQFGLLYQHLLELEVAA